MTGATDKPRPGSVLHVSVAGGKARVVTPGGRIYFVGEGELLNLAASVGYAELDAEGRTPVEALMADVSSPNAAGEGLEVAVREVEGAARRAYAGGDRLSALWVQRRLGVALERWRAVTGTEE